MAEQQTIDHLVGLAVAMLGVAPGTDWLNARAKDIDAGATVDDVANQIQSSGDFEARYPAFLSDAKFAEDFLGDLIGGHVTDAIMVAAVDLVTGQLKAGASRGEVAAFLVEALTIVAADEDNAFYADFGKAATAFHNKVMVAKHYTEEARMEDPSASVLEGVTDAADSVTAAINLINNPPQPPAEPETGKRFVLTPTIDDFEGGDLGDTFIAQPVQGSDGIFNATLQSFDSIDGGGGVDTIHIFGINPRDDLRLGAEDIVNVENVVINTVGGIDANLGDWAGLEMVTLDRFGRDNESNVKITVDGASVHSDRTFEGDVTIVGASGAVDIEAGSPDSDGEGGSVVHIGSAGHTETVAVKGGAKVMVDSGASGNNKYSTTVTSVSVDGVARDNPDSTGERSDTRSHYNLRTDFDKYVLAPNGDRVQLTIAEGGAVDFKVDKADDSKEVVDVTNAAGVAIVNGGFTLQYDPVSGNLMWMRNEGTATDVTEPTLATDVSMERVEYFPLLEDDVKQTLEVHSNAIESVHLHNTTAIALIDNNSKMDDGKRMPEDLAVTVNNYGSFNPNGTVKQAGKLCIGGNDAGSAENIDITAAGANAFDLASRRIKTLDISGEGRLVLDVDNFNEDSDPSNDGVSKTLESVTVSGSVGVTMANLSGMSKLKMIDASESSGTNHFRSQAASSGQVAADELAALTMVQGGSGRDIFTLRTSVTGKLENVHTGDGNDSVTITGLLRNGGIDVDLGAGDDTYSHSGGASNGKSRVDGGEGADTLHLTSTANSTYRDADNKVQSIYSGFETLNVARGSGDYDIEQLGIVNDVLVTESTTGGGVTLEKMADGMGLRVSGTWGFSRSRDNEATIVHELAERKSGEARASGELDLHLAAVGRNDTRSSQEGKAELTLTTGEDIEVINITSNATPHSRSSTPANQRARASDYVNKLTLTSAHVEELIVDGNAQLVIESGDFDSLELVDAQDNSGGVTFDASDDGSGTALTQGLELVGGSGVDRLTGGGVADEITGGLGGDTLTGGAGADDFIIDSADESMARFAIVNGVNTLLGGYDIITDFDLATDEIDLSRGLLNAVSGNIKNTIAVTDGEWNDWQLWDNDGDSTTARVARYTSIDGIDNGGNPQASDDTTAKNLVTFIDDGNGLFESKEPPTGALNTDVGAQDRTAKYSIAVVIQAANDGTGNSGADDELDAGAWLLFDVNGDGDFNADDDMVIFLQGTYAATAWDSTGDGAGIFI